MKFFFVFLLSLNFLACSTPAPAPHATIEEKKYVYTNRDLFPEIQQQISDSPAKDSAVQLADEKELRKAQKSRTAKDCERANSEVVVTLQSLYGKPYSELTEQQIAVLNPFFDSLRGEFGPYIGQVKKAYSRLRPYDYLKDLNPCVPKEPSLAYPSGHAIIASFYAFILKDLLPEKTAQWEKRMQVIGRDRILGGVHHPSDIESGKKMGQFLYTELAKSPLYQVKVQEYKLLLK